MHTQLLVTFALKDADTSEAAREHVHATLIGDQSFIGEGGRYFGSPLADWFVIGGRWSGTLARTGFPVDFFAVAERRFPPEHPFGYSEAEIEEHTGQLQALWEELGGTDTQPYGRDAHRDGGYADDARIVDATLYDRLLAPYAGQDGDDATFVDLDCEAVAPDFVGRKWLVVVDYHS